MHTTMDQNEPTVFHPSSNGASSEAAAATRTNKSIAHASDSALTAAAPAVERTGANILRYGLVGILATMGAMKFTDYEAKGIAPLLQNSPIFAALTKAFGVRAVSRGIGVTEIAIAGLIALRPRSPGLSALGSGLAVGMFATTLSFLASTPGAVTKSKRGIPILSSNVGQVLAKDVMFAGAAVWTLGEALRARR